MPASGEGPKPMTGAAADPGGRLVDRCASAATAPPVNASTEANGERGKANGVALKELGANHYRCDVTIVNDMGLHARPATLFVKLANSFASEIVIRKGNNPVDGKSILQLFSLAAEVGTPLVLEAKGADAPAALTALAALIAAGFNESAGATGAA